MGGAKREVTKIGALDVSVLKLQPPIEKEPKHRFCSLENELYLQTNDVTYALSSGGVEPLLELLYEEVDADKISGIDEALCSIIANSSAEWFGQQISYDHIERMFRSTLEGGKNPRQTLNVGAMRTFDTNNKMTTAFPPTGSAVFIMKLEGVRFEEKACEPVWSVVQGKETVPACAPMFV